MNFNSRQNVSLQDSFAIDAYLDKKHDPYFKKKPKNGIYADVLIVSCQRDNWWYAKYVGITCFVSLQYFNNSRGILSLYSATTVRIENSMIHTGRDFDLKDIVIL